MRVSISTGLMLAVCVLGLTGAGCATTPTATAKPEERPVIYNPTADGEQQLAGALAQARETNKRVLLDLGANWCGDSQAMYRLLTTGAEISREVKEHFVLALVDVNQRGGANRNPELLARLGNPLLGRGIPVLLVLGPDGALLNTDPTERLSDTAYKEPASVLAYLRKWRGEQ